MKWILSVNDNVIVINQWNKAILFCNNNDLNMVSKKRVHSKL
jgi:hypothetical protein